MVATFPYTFMGLQPGVTKQQVRDALVRFSEGDNRITDLSAAHCLTPGTGWDIPPGDSSCAGQPMYLRAPERRPMFLPCTSRSRTTR